MVSYSSMHELHGKEAERVWAEFRGLCTHPWKWVLRLMTVVHNHPTSTNQVPAVVCIKMRIIQYKGTKVVGACMKCLNLCSSGKSQTLE